MQIEKENKYVTIYDTDYLVPTYLIGNISSPKEIFSFSNGFCIRPDFYKKFFEILLKENPNLLIIAPDINGTKIKGNSYGINMPNFPNNSIKNCKSLHDITVNQLYNSTISNITSEVSIDFSHSLKLGHSTGGGINGRYDLGDSVLINPLMPVEYGIAEFILRAGILSGTEAIGADGLKGLIYRSIDQRNNIDFIKKFTSNWKNNFDLMRDFGNITLEDIYGKGENNSPPIILYAGKNGKDQYFDYEKHRPELENIFTNLIMKGIKGSHETIIYDPERFIKAYHEALEELRR